MFGKVKGGNNLCFVDGGYNSSYSNSTSARFVMNTTNTNSGGWKSSYMRSTICSAFLSALPSELQNAISFCTKYTDNTGGGADTASYVTGTNDKIWLLAEWEVFGTREDANSSEQNYQKQYEYFKNGGSKIFYKHNSTSIAAYWWLRSVYCGDSERCCIVYTNGSISIDQSSGILSGSHGFAPGFMIA
jgi:hypothetical protein